MLEAIRIENLTKIYGRRRQRVVAVDSLNLEVQAGQVYGFLGPNGAGKTTTIRMMLDLIRPTRGRVCLYGRDVRTARGVLSRVGSIVEGAAAYSHLTGRRNLEVLARTGSHFDPRRIESLLEQVGLADRAGEYVKGYSLGMKQRLGLAAALLSDPDLVILDEPTNGLDPAGIIEVRQFIRRLVDEEGKTVFFSSHILGEVEQVCDRVAIIHKGRIVREGAVSDLLASQSSLCIEATPLDRAEAVLREEWDVSPNGHTLTVSAAHEDVPCIVRKLVENNIEIYQVASQRQTLEEYFLSVTQTQELEKVEHA